MPRSESLEYSIRQSSGTQWQVQYSKKRQQWHRFTGGSLNKASALLFLNNCTGAVVLFRSPKCKPAAVASSIFFLCIFMRYVPACKIVRRADLYRVKSRKKLANIILDARLYCSKLLARIFFVWSLASFDSVSFFCSLKVLDFLNHAFFRVCLNEWNWRFWIIVKRIGERKKVKSNLIRFT